MTPDWYSSLLSSTALRHGRARGGLAGLFWFRKIWVLCGLATALFVSFVSAPEEERFASACAGIRNWI
jgi:hypothetical protein